jgi:hypothetical protein
MDLLLTLAGLADVVRGLHPHEDRTRKGTPDYRIAPAPRDAFFLRNGWAGYIIVTIGLPDPDQLFLSLYMYARCAQVLA